MARMCSALLVVAVVLSVSGLPPSPRAPETTTTTPDAHLHARRPAADKDKVLAIGVPMALSRYLDYATPDPAVAPEPTNTPDAHLHARRQAADKNKVLAIGVPMALSRYLDYATPDPAVAPEPTTTPDGHLHARRQAADKDKVLAIGVPMALSRYLDYATSDPAASPAVAPRASWWGRSSYFYKTVFKCAKGEKRDAIGICRQPWDSIDSDEYFPS